MEWTTLLERIHARTPRTGSECLTHYACHSDSVLRSLVKFLKENSSTKTIKLFRKSLHLSWCFAGRVVRTVPAINIFFAKITDLPKEVSKIHIRCHPSVFAAIFTLALAAGFLTIHARASFSNCSRLGRCWGGRRSAWWRRRTLSIRPGSRDDERRVRRCGSSWTWRTSARLLGLYAGRYEQWWGTSGHGIWRVVGDRYRQDSGTHWRHSYKAQLRDWNSSTLKFWPFFHRRSLPNSLPANRYGDRNLLFEIFPSPSPHPHL